MIYKITIILLFSLIQFSANAQQRYQLDNKKSKLLWKVETIGKHNGYILFSSGTLDYSKKNEPTVGFFTLDMKNMRSLDKPTPDERKKVDAQLRSPDFFDVAAHPTATMDVKRINRTANATIYKVAGNLTIKGITKPIEFLATINKSAGGINVSAQLKINRTNWNIDHKPDSKDLFPDIKDMLIADDIAISLNLTFNK